MTNIQAVGQGIAKLATGPATVVGLAGAGVVGFGAAHAISNHGDYQHNRSWTMLAALASGGVGAGAALLGARGSRMARVAMEGAPALANEVHLAALNVASATGARKVTAAARLEEAVAAHNRHYEVNAASGKVGLGLVQMAAMLGVGASAGVAVTSTRLDPGTLHVVADWNVNHETESFGEQRADEVRDVASGVKSGAGGVKNWIGDHVGNPFG
jgi:hypothetical protein